MALLRTACSEASCRAMSGLKGLLAFMLDQPPHRPTDQSEAVAAAGATLCTWSTC
jgi:hypothetical protein